MIPPACLYWGICKFLHTYVYIYTLPPAVDARVTSGGAA